MRWRIRPSTIAGSTTVPGDKSIAHRALMLGALAPGTSTVENLPHGEDVRSTAACLRALNTWIEMRESGATIRSAGELSAPPSDLDSGNSGTTMRLLAGILAGQSFSSRLTGDASLRRRPMRRVVEPLRQMGASIGSDAGKPPLEIRGGELHAIRYTLPVHSAQVKSAILLAALFAEGTTWVEEPVRTRDHTERFLRAAGVDVRVDHGAIAVMGGQRPRCFTCCLPGDMSSAAFFFAAAALAGGAVQIRGVGINPTRSYFLQVVERMGAEVEVAGEHMELEEPVASVTVAGRATRPIEIDPEHVPLAVDELPLVALLATQARGTSTVRGAAELRVKETDRIAAVVGTLGAMGADIEELPDGFIVRGPTPLRGAKVASGGDHRMAMMLAVAGCAAEGETVVTDAEAAAVSFPAFAEALERLGGRIDAI